MLIRKFLPGVLKELLKHVPTVLFQVVDWNELMSEIPRLSRRILQKEGHDLLFESQQQFLSPLDIVLIKSPPEKLQHKIDKWSAEKVLELFFAQIFSPHGIFLDLGSHHFIPDPPKLNWHPSGLWTKLHDDFQKGLIHVYDGFYNGDEGNYFKGLEEIGLISKEWSEADKQKLGELFRAQFGSSHDKEMTFDLDHFRTAILKTSDFLLKKKVKITKDFLYLGIYLVILYSHLEQTHEKLPVRDIYLKVRKNFT